jgi:hypothetical protein
MEVLPHCSTHVDADRALKRFISNFNLLITPHPPPAAIEIILKTTQIYDSELPTKDLPIFRRVWKIGKSDY